jgi:hypothetical protein
MGERERTEQIDALVAAGENMSRKGHYSGGSTIIGPRTPGWFKKGSIRATPNTTAPKLPLKPAEKAALKLLKDSRETGSRLIPKGQVTKKKLKYGKAKPNNPSIIKLEPSRPQKGVTVVSQALRHGRSRTIVVEFATHGKPAPGPDRKPRTKR